MFYGDGRLVPRMFCNGGRLVPRMFCNDGHLVPRMFRTLLIANRGEIACRIARTAQRLGIETVAVFSDADANALHVRTADRAIRIGPPPARESYLDIPRIIAAAQQSGAQAIHPGYGFLSENPDFAEACAAAGLVFVGPPASAMRAMGSKSAAKTLMQQSGVPLLPGYHGDNQDPAFLAAQARRRRLSGASSRRCPAVAAAACAWSKPPRVSPLPWPPPARNPPPRSATTAC